MKKVTLLGDSIRQIGYGLKVPELLGEEYEVFQPTDNCRFAKYTLLGLDDWKADLAGSDIIHWNNGLWDVCNRFGDGSFSTKEEYVQNMLRVARLLKRITPNVIFATTTPVHENQKTIKDEVICEYNAIIVPELVKMDIKINDLYSFVKPHIFEYVREDDKMHLTEAGIDACSAEVVRHIKMFG